MIYEVMLRASQVVDSDESYDASSFPGDKH